MSETKYRVVQDAQEMWIEEWSPRYWFFGWHPEGWLRLYNPRVYSLGQAIGWIAVWTGRNTPRVIYEYDPAHDEKD